MAVVDFAGAFLRAGTLPAFVLAVVFFRGAAFLLMADFFLTVARFLADTFFRAVALPAGFFTDAVFFFAAALDFADFFLTAM
ncbi:MAG: hypothetical protein PVI50_01895 [Gammaproteobacteria bacterium]